MEKLRSGDSGKPDLVLPSMPREGVYRQRQVELAKQLFTLMNIPRDDREKRLAWTSLGFRFFDAPAAIILMCDQALPEVSTLLDIGALMQTISLVALNYGLGTCIADQGIQYPDVIRRQVNVPESKTMIISVSIGYPDWDFPANKIETQREAVENLSAWHGF